MAGHNETGKTGEDIAAAYLAEKGYTILERNWHNRHLEIDIIATKGTELVIAEVKCRSYQPIAEPYTAVNRNKQKLLIKAANAYIEKTGTDAEVRFDIISVTLGRSIKIEHLENAFYPQIGR